jgi:hypothetical protein
VVETGLPQLEPIYGCQPFGAHTRCADIHHGPLPANTRCVCEVCGRTGAHLEARIKLLRIEADAQERAQRIKQRADLNRRTEAQRRAARGQAK